jgi:hypothetical protein
MLLAAFVFLYFIGAVRGVLDGAESRARGTGQLARVAYAGALTGMVGMTIAFVTFAAASTDGSHADAADSRSAAAFWRDGRGSSRWSARPPS